MSNPTPFYGARGEPATLRRAINDAINTYIAYECETDSERATELAVEYMFSEYGLKDEPPLDAPTSWSNDPKRVQWHTDHPPYDAGPAEYDAKLDWAMGQIAALRLALDEAHQHVGALVASAEDIWDILAELITASIDNDRERGRAALDRVLDTGFDTSAARAWLRRA